MKPTFGRILLALIILLFGTATTAQAIDPNSIDKTSVTCDDPPTSWNGEITTVDQVDYYSIDLVAGQVLSIDVDAEDLSSSLDSLLEVFDGAGNPIGASDDDKAPDEITVVDPYFELTADVDGTYYLAISASSKSDGEETPFSNTGSYMLFLQCSAPSNQPGPVADVEVGDLLGTSGSENRALISINPDDGQSSLRFPLEVGPIADIDVDPVSKVLFAAINTGYPGIIVSINPNDGTQISEFNYPDGGFVALEFAGEVLYGVHLTTDDMDTAQAVDKYSLVTISEGPDGLLLTPVASFTGHISSLAYHSAENALYGASGADLIKFDLTVSPVSVEKIGSLDLEGIVALDFDPNNILYGVDISGNLFRIPEPTLTNEGTVKTVKIGPIDASGGVNGLTFVVGGTPPDEEPIKTLCSSTLTTTTATSETDNPKLSKLKLKNNPLHRAIGLFKFQGKAGERVTLRLAPEGEEAAVSGEETALSPLVRYWLNCRGKGRVFLGIRDAIPNVNFRARKKDQMPFDMSADLPEDGYYYVMVIRPLLRFYKTDYCLTIESDHPDSQAWQTLDVVWPGDDSEEDTAATSTEEKAVLESVDTSSDQVVQEVEETTTEGTVETAPVKEITAEVTEQTAVMDAPQVIEATTVEPAPVKETTAEVTEQTAVTDAPQVIEATTVEPAPVKETAAEVTEQPAVLGAPQITEETTVDETGEVTPEESALKN
jgi:hypothetical protein